MNETSGSGDVWWFTSRARAPSQPVNRPLASLFLIHVFLGHFAAWKVLVWESDGLTEICLCPLGLSEWPSVCIFVWITSVARVNRTSAPPQTRAVLRVFERLARREPWNREHQCLKFILLVSPFNWNVFLQPWNFPTMAVFGQVLYAVSLINQWIRDQLEGMNVYSASGNSFVLVVVQY